MNLIQMDNFLFMSFFYFKIVYLIQIFKFNYYNSEFDISKDFEKDFDLRHIAESYHIILQLIYLNLTILSLIILFTILFFLTKPYFISLFNFILQDIIKFSFLISFLFIALVIGIRVILNQSLNFNDFKNSLVSLTFISFGIFNIEDQEDYKNFYYIFELSMVIFFFRFIVKGYFLFVVFKNYYRIIIKNGFFKQSSLKLSNFGII